MKRTQMILSGAVLVISFLFLPSEAWVFWLTHGDEALYGEFHMQTGAETFVVAKNLHAEKIKLHGEEVSAHWTWGIDGGPVVALGKGGEVLPRSYSLVELQPGDSDKPDGPVRGIDGEPYFSVEDLTLSVPVERDKWALLVVSLLVAACALTSSTALYLVESGVLASDTEEDC